MPKARKMTNLTIEETSGVDHPAHLREGWLVIKSEDAGDLSNGLPRVVVKENGKMTTDELRAELDKARKRIGEMEEEMASYKSKAKKADDEEMDEEDELMKAAPPQVVALFEKARVAREEALEKAAAAEAELAAERDAKADAEAIEKARRWDKLSLDPAEVGPQLRRLGEFDADLAKSVEGLLDSVNAQSDSAGIFEEIGKSAAPTEGADDAYGRIQALAKAAVDGGNAATMEQAIADVAAKHPDLYVEMLTKKGA